ncbi:MAG: hypothetical protein IKK33_16710 [Lachnospiraceae bacterium]|nr:hypothetical protein [Lachnospiraceae bacterium]
MKFWEKLFKKKRQRYQEEDWEQLIYTREGVNFELAEERKSYVDECLEQMVVAAKELELLGGEYSLVTAYLTDTEEVEALPQDEQDALMVSAKRLRVVEQERNDYLTKENRMPDSVYYSMKDKEEELEEGIRKLKEAEEYGSKIKQDLKRLSRERHAYAYRKDELLGIRENLKGMFAIFAGALVVCITILAILQFGFKLNTAVGCFVAVVAAAIAFTVIWLKFTEAGRELLRVEKATNKLIQLQNKVKIKYVNNTNLLNYLYLKYQVENCKTLEKQYEAYLQEKEERKQYEEAEAKREYYIRNLTEQLTRFRVRYPERFTSNVDALLNHKELVEMRHDLIIRRQTLRKQINYNSDVIKTVKKEIKDIAFSYPDYEQEISAKLTEFETRFKGVE